MEDAAIGSEYLLEDIREEALQPRLDYYNHTPAQLFTLEFGDATKRYSDGVDTLLKKDSRADVFRRLVTQFPSLQE